MEQVGYDGDEAENLRCESKNPKILIFGYVLLNFINLSFVFNKKTIYN